MHSKNTDVVQIRYFQIQDTSLYTRPKLWSYPKYLFGNTFSQAKRVFTLSNDVSPFFVLFWWMKNESRKTWFNL